MFLGFRIHHVARKLEIIVGLITLGGLLTPGGRGVAKSVGKGTWAALSDYVASSKERKRLDRELRDAVEKGRIMQEMYDRNPEFRTAVDKAVLPKHWWSR
jgi:hypothetical protein